MVRTLLVLSATGWMMSAAAAGQTGAADRTLDRGGQSGIEGPRQVATRTQAEWAALWQEHAPTRPLPPVDFSREMVLAVFLGSRPTAGYSVDIVRTRQQDGDLIAEYRETTPPAGRILAQVITAPFVIVAVAQRPGPVRFEKLR